jgi:hypothetical protein
MCGCGDESVLAVSPVQVFSRGEMEDIHVNQTLDRKTTILQLQTCPVLSVELTSHNTIYHNMDVKP